MALARDSDGPWFFFFSPGTPLSRAWSITLKMSSSLIASSSLLRQRSDCPLGISSSDPSSLGRKPSSLACSCQPRTLDLECCSMKSLAAAAKVSVLRSFTSAAGSLPWAIWCWRLATSRRAEAKVRWPPITWIRFGAAALCDVVDAAQHQLGTAAISRPAIAQCPALASSLVQDQVKPRASCIRNFPLCSIGPELGDSNGCQLRHCSPPKKVTEK